MVRNLNTWAASLSALRRDQRGVATIEMSVIFGALLMILFGSLQFGRALAARNEMNHALSEAVRIVHIDPTTTTAQIVSYLESELADYGTGDLDVTISAISGTSYMQVDVSYPFSFAIPFAGTSDITLQATTLAPMVSPTQ